MNEPEKRTRLLSVRLTVSEYADLDARAQLVSLEISAYVRKTILNAPAPQRARRQSHDVAALGRVLVALNRIGSNINQIAREAHRNGNVEIYRDAEADREIIAAAARAVMEAMNAA